MFRVRRLIASVAIATFLITLLAQSMPASAEPLHDGLVGAVNAYRVSRGLPAVAASPTLQAAAQFMAENVAAYGPPAIPHRSTDGRMPRQRMADAGYPVDQAFTSEIIAWGATTAIGAMNLWIASPPHWAQLNDGRFVAAGLGVACSGSMPCVWVVTFGSIADAAYPAAPPAPTYHAAFKTESAFPTASPGQTVQWVVAFTNTGTTGWSTNGASALRVGTSQPLDSSSVLAATTWLAPSRPAQQTTTFVGPGQDAWFIVELTAPSAAGTYRLWLRPVIDGVQWLEDAGVYVDLVVR
jgi:hypothetical protein